MRIDLLGIHFHIRTSRMKNELKIDLKRRGLRQSTIWTMRSLFSITRHNCRHTSKFFSKGATAPSLLSTCLWITFLERHYWATLRRQSHKSIRSILSCSSGERTLSHLGRLGICILLYLEASSGSFVCVTALTSRSIITALPFSVSKFRWDKATVSRKSS